MIPLLVLTYILQIQHAILQVKYVQWTEVYPKPYQN